MLPFEIRVSIYKSFIVPHFNYCAETWHFCSKISADKLEKVNGRAVRFVFKDKSTPYEDLLVKLGSTPLRHQRAMKILGTVYKLINNSNTPESLRGLIERRNSVYNLRGKDILKIPKSNTTTYGLKSWRYQAAKLWNALPDTVRTAANLKAFKKGLHDIELM